ncbi:MAG TPA: family 16 glycosylhydrolase, partial [Fusibacter sp.]|nr:family 16 glycosylhydrolase [Fusibacter sp.]
MKKKLSVFLVSALLLTTIFSFALPGNAVSSKNDLEDEFENNMLFNSKFKTALSTAVPNDQGIVDTEKSWIFFTNSGAEGYYEKSKFGARVVPTNILGKPNYGIQLIQSPVSLDNLGIYKVSIVAKADSSRKLTLKVGATGDKGWTAYGMKEINLTTKFAQYDFEFTMYGAADPNARFEIFFADAQSPVDIKRAYMTKIGMAEPVITMEDLLKRTKTEADENVVENWELAWSDEFDGATLDASKWTAEIGNGAEKNIPGWGNGELQYYTDSPQNVLLEDGKLIIRAQKEQKTFTVNGQDYTTDYTSARLITDGKFSVAYGKIESRMKLPSGQGFWPAFWMLGQNIGEVGWPTCGEIDILEYIGSKVTEVNGTVHGPISAGPGINYKIDTGIDMSLDFHTYSIEWDEDEVEFYVDDILYHIVNKDEVAVENGPDEWVYDHPHFLILNLAVGGSWPGAPNLETVFPSQLEVDYIRVYQDTNPASINGEEVIDSIYEKPVVTPGIEAFS